MNAHHRSQAQGSLWDYLKRRKRWWLTPLLLLLLASVALLLAPAPDVPTSVHYPMF